MEISVEFLGVMAEIAGTGAKHYSGITSFDDLMYRLRDDIPALVHSDYHISINGAIPEGTLVLRDGDRITLMPSFAGGCFLTRV